MKKAILLVAYGPGSPQGRRSLAHFEAACKQRFPGWPVRWAYTSGILRERLLLQKQKSDSVAKALMRLAVENFKAAAIQPLQIIPGAEHEETRQQILAVQRNFSLACAVGNALLCDSEHLAKVAAALPCLLPKERQPRENALFMAHGAKHAAGRMYSLLDSLASQHDRLLRVGAMNGGTDLDAILPALAPGPVWLLPLLSTIGGHALRDMAGHGPTAWRTRLEAAGHPCRPVLSGLTESEAISGIWLDNLAAAMAKLEA